MCSTVLRENISAILEMSEQTHLYELMCIWYVILLFCISLKEMFSRIFGGMYVKYIDEDDDGNQCDYAKMSL